MEPRGTSEIEVFCNGGNADHLAACKSRECHLEYNVTLTNKVLLIFIQICQWRDGDGTWFKDDKWSQRIQFQYANEMLPTARDLTKTKSGFLRSILYWARSFEANSCLSPMMFASTWFFPYQWIVFGFGFIWFDPVFTAKQNLLCRPWLNPSGRTMNRESN